MKYKFKRVEEHGYVITEEGHTMFPEDVVQRLKTIDFLKAKRSAMCEANSNAVLGEGFDINTAIEDKGNCKRQIINCEECKMGKFIFENGMKTRVDDLCDYNIVYLLAKVVKTFV